MSFNLAAVLPQLLPSVIEWTENPDAFAEKVAEMPLGRMGTPEEVANAVVFLCSPRARYIVGINVIIDGGRSDRPHY